MKRLKFYFCSVLVGILYLLMAFCFQQLCEGMIDCFRSMMHSSGLIAVANFLGGVFIIACNLLIVFVMGAIPLGIAYDLKELKEEKKEKNDG